MAAEATASAPRSFCERQKALCLLSSLIEEHEQWMGSLLQNLGWERDSLLPKEVQAYPTLIQCPVNKHHFIPRASVEEHTQKCRYAALGVQSDIENLSCDGGFLYDDSVVPCIEIDSSVQTAVARLARESEVSQESVSAPLVPFRRDFIDQSEVVVESHDSLVTQEYFSSLEDSCSAPSEVIAQHPTQVIRFVKAWKLVPQDFVSIALSTINVGEVKGWLFKHLPQDHALSTKIGGEMQVVEGIMQWLTPGHDGAIDPLTPNTLMNMLKPLLRLKTRAFVMELWKFLHISRLQREHSISDSVVEDLPPLTLAQTTGKEPSLVGRIKVLLEQQQHPGGGESALPLPMDHVRCTLSTEERRILYDYVVECTTKSRDPDLYDQTGVKTNTPDEGGGEGGDAGGGGGDEDKRKYLETLKAERDYKRRRQTYRAKNVRITKRTPVEIFRHMIEAGMEEIAASQQRQVGDIRDEAVAERIHLSIDQSPSSLERDTQKEVPSHHSRNRSKSRSPDRPSKHHHSERDQNDKRSATPKRSRKKSESPKHRRKEGKGRKHSHHSRSHSKSRGQSRERPSRKRSRSHSRSRGKRRQKSNSRSKSRDREKHRHRSRSRSKSRDRERHRHKSKSRSKSRDREKHRHRSRSRSKSRDRERHRRNSRSPNRSSHKTQDEIETKMK